jgi:alanyl-tRNA synthetase
MTQQTSTAILDCQAISEAFLALHEQEGFVRLPASSLLHPSVPMSFVMSAGLIQVENELDRIVQQTGGRFAFTQRCFRHFDIQRVGEDSTHLSLFHMSAAFHIGSSQRETVLPRLWYFLTQTLGLKPERLWMTYLDDPEFGRDEQNYQCWKSLGVDESRLVGLDQQHCFWRQRQTGQIAQDGKKCGPHTEVFYERADVECSDCGQAGHRIGSCHCGRFVEISNSLFIENYIADDGSLIPAESVFSECVIGVERISMVLQGAKNIYHTHRFQPYRQRLYFHQPALQQFFPPNDGHTNIILDHLTAFIALVKDGAPAPGQGGRSRIMRVLARGMMTHAILADMEFDALYQW